LEAGEAWGRPPWEVEETASGLWIERFSLWQSAKGRRFGPKGARVGESESTWRGDVETRRTRLI
jgi:hypothetical protein